MVLNETYCRFFTRNAGVGRLSTTTDSRGARHPYQSANSANSFTLASWDLGLHRACTTLDLGPSCGRPDQSLLRLDSFARGNVLVRIAVMERRSWKTVYNHRLARRTPPEPIRQLCKLIHARLLGSRAPPRMHNTCSWLSCRRPDQSLLRLDSFARGNDLVRIAVIDRFLRQCATATRSPA